MDDRPLITTTRLDQAFFAQAGRTPGAPAIYFQGQVIAYDQLADTVSWMSADLSRHGVGPGVIVALNLQRTPMLLATVLAILDAGGAYLPLDQRNPPERMDFVLADSGAAILIVDAEAPPPGSFDGLVLELSGGRFVQRSSGGRPRAPAPHDLAYVIYTSGSTGRPKGVMLGHGAIHLVDWARDTFPPEVRARVGATTSLSFDPSVFEIFVPLCTGGAVILKENALQPFTADERPTLLDSVPSVLAELCRAGAVPGGLHVLNVGGEALRADLAQAVYRDRPDLTLYNHYGPTEATTCATVAKVPRRLVGEPAIGRPVRGATIVLLDDQGHAVEDGETGEIHIGGPGLALGYLNQPELTAQRFIHRPGGRLYRTGDLAVWRDGDLYFAGRSDQQVKVRGFRVELGEVEAALSRVTGVEQAVVLMRHLGGRSEMTAYVQSPAGLTEPDLRQALAAWLPDYMVPARFVVVRALPLLVSGKVDQSRLPEPADQSPPPPNDVSRMEWPIVHVFEEVLGRTGIRPEQSFFHLGGDSIASVQAALRLEELLGYELPAALIHQAPSARALAASLEHGRVRVDSHITLLQQGGDGTPLFCMADLFGQAFNYLSLARELAVDRSVYGVVPGPAQARFTRDGDVRALTDGFLTELRTVRPEGPYLIAGHSAGGLLAADIACALQEQGETVRLVMLDAFSYGARPSVGAIARWVLRPRSGRPSEPRPPGDRRALSMVAKILRQWLPGAPPDWLPKSQVAFAARMIRAGVSYRPRPFTGPAMVIKAANRDPIDEVFDADGVLGWSPLLKGELIVRSVPGTHYTFMRDPWAELTAEAIRPFLADTEKTPARAAPGELCLEG